MISIVYFNIRHIRRSATYHTLYSSSSSSSISDYSLLNSVLGPELILLKNPLIVLGMQGKISFHTITIFFYNAAWIVFSNIKASAKWLNVEHCALSCHGDTRSPVPGPGVLERLNSQSCLHKKARDASGATQGQAPEHMAGHSQEKAGESLPGGVTVRGFCVCLGATFPMCHLALACTW